MSTRPLTAKQQRFVDEYLTDLNITQAAIRAGYSPRSARVIGQETLLNPAVSRAIAQAQAERRATAKMTADEVVEGLTRIARAKLSDVVEWGVKQVAVGYDDEGKRLAPEDIDDAVVVHYVEQPYVLPRSSKDLSADVLDAVSEVAVTKDGGVRIKMHGKVGAYERLGRHLGVFAEEGAPPATVNFNIYGLYREDRGDERPNPRRVQGPHEFKDPARR